MFTTLLNVINREYTHHIKIKKNEFWLIEAFRLKRILSNCGVNSELGSKKAVPLHSNFSIFFRF